MTPEGLAATHAAAFPGKGWDAATFSGYLADQTATFTGTEACFALLRRAGDEAEILTLATRPDRQGQGLGTAVLGRALDAARDAGVSSVFLEVAANNIPARALYRGAGFDAVAERKDYYRAPDGSRTTALILRKSL